MSQTEILVIDDDDEFRQRLTESIPDDISYCHDVHGLDRKNFESEMKILEDRRRSSRAGNHPPSRKSLFDSAAYAFIDYDLLDYENEGLATTGEDVAYLARVFSDVGTIITLNSLATTPTFDLTLKVPLHSFGDLSLSADDICNPQLWDQPDGQSYRPWAWPMLRTLPSALCAQSKALEGKLDEPLLDVLHLRDVVDEIDRAYLDKIGSDIHALNVRDFVRSSPIGVKPRDSFMRSGRGKTPTEMPDSRLARIAATRIVRWLEYLLAGEHILVDAPHLFSRIPQAFGPVNTGEDPSALSRLYEEFEAPAIYSLPEELEGSRYPLSNFCGRDVWLWPAILENEALDELLSQEGVADNVFCEDVSGFRPFRRARSFRADIPTSFPSRFVSEGGTASDKDGEKIGVKYEPAVRLLE